MTARLAHQMAIENAHITADVVEATEFPELVQRYQVRGVPKIILNETSTPEGALSEERLIEKVIAAAAGNS